MLKPVNSSEVPVGVFTENARSVSGALDGTLIATGKFVAVPPDKEGDLRHPFQSEADLKGPIEPVGVLREAQLRVE